jgi:hypothetical protein
MNADWSGSGCNPKMDIAETTRAFRESDATTISSVGERVVKLAEDACRKSSELRNQAVKELAEIEGVSRHTHHLLWINSLGNGDFVCAVPASEVDRVLSMSPKRDWLAARYPHRQIPPVIDFKGEIGSPPYSGELESSR